ncbi:uncharacterized protein LOC117642913 [Thrips palmi]|uniref:Uncharacterized protein LOC117642913 n=1 Tax=Thrips palmi TaxID=161013 RepID=A0A6P8YTP3_THRPL|nr:uncharacterized protein LOC117642913 [Thrips palmi]
MKVEAGPIGFPSTGAMYFRESAMDKGLMRLARLLGLAPYVQIGRKITQPRWLYWYSIGVTVIPSLGALLFLIGEGTAFIQHARRHLSMAEVVITIGHGIMALGLILSRLFIVRRQYPQLQRVLIQPMILTEAFRTPQRGALLVFCPDLARTLAYFVVMPCVYASGILSAWYMVLSMMLACEQLLESAELMLFMFLLDTLAHNYKRLNEELSHLKQFKERGRNISEEILQGLGSVVNFFVLILQMREVKIVSKPVLEGANNTSSN